jgi:integrase
LAYYPETALRAARERRDTERKLLAEGIDPSKSRKTEKSAQANRAANSFEQVARDWFAKFSPSWAPAHAARKIRPVDTGLGNRHTFCSWLAIAGVSIKEIQVLAGHRTITMADRYANLSPDVTASASERLVLPGL